ncbi:MAG: aminotransferase class I/II-fold pyridoxal phosphate-dependent enzyme [Furfurilactobacillus sp.]|jgi:aminotransferase|uniref:Aminotransferase n=1 Tax=Furfurilactobacillus milii TaxID=2888272 RepID=A0ABT6DAA9_9LACO|nr:MULTISPECIES: aminotransferase class I/II-fold pyridoxal phosphate-dependent enzyme [Furfurilactobacillus]QLE67721.1 Aspartate-tyrosine-aromatic aminotransferase [Furfurilactobacillus rossiae]MCF6160428.1 aminotransferase class I/II-fold pyridoxal phosphate-dependent enzyme [Furfurilactobacillus milii]MCF6162660.1 aminotransferase class I/II-fold pyridoxal phosphate-dependent enzyme [Furfurilactobacillus milii]MCF6418332.1 aminotransferase class I/II-fold pyridoxal phosphate-dependent enzyme
MQTQQRDLAQRLNTQLLAIKPDMIHSFDHEVSDIPNIIKLTLGEPDFNVPEHVKQAAIKSIEDNDSHYAPVPGTTKLREAAAHFLADRYGIQYDPQTEIVATVGATEAISDTLRAVTNPGDKVLLPGPTFPLYEPIIKLNGAEVVPINTEPNQFVLTPQQLQAAINEYGDDIKAIMLNFPSNPTGVTYTANQIEALADVLRDTNIIVISDEIYSELTYGQPHVSFAHYLPEQTLVLNGVSKSHAMTGYRVGILAGPAALIGRINLMHAFTVTSASNPAMAAAAEALGTEQGRHDTENMKAEYKQRRDFVYNTMTKLGFTIPKPAGAFYIFAKIPERLHMTDYDFCLSLAQTSQVAVIPGAAFGPGGEGYLRLSYAASMTNLKTAMARLTTYMETH